MVKFKWPADRIQLQRAILLSIIGLISCGIIRGHRKYEQEVAAYMSSLEYRQAKEASHDYSVKKMKRNQQLAALDDAPPSSDRSAR